jgi:hypothetical protein
VDVNLVVVVGCTMCRFISGSETKIIDLSEDCRMILKWITFLGSIEVGEFLA